MMLLGLLLIICGAINPITINASQRLDNAVSSRFDNYPIHPITWDRTWQELAITVESSHKVPFRSDEDFTKEQKLIKMADEIQQYWIFYYRLETALKKPWPITAKNLRDFRQYSRDLAEIVEYYKENETDIGGKLPDHENIHIFFAMMVGKESGVNSKAVGKRGEVGLIQVHKTALNGYNRLLVKATPRLGLELGVRWMTSKLSVCRRDIDLDNWTDEDWLGPLTIYAAGEGEGRAKRGRCAVIGLAKRRVGLIKRFRDKKLDKDV